MRRDYYFFISVFSLITFFGLSSLAYCQNSGAVSTLAGSAGVSAFADGTGNAAAFNWPFELTVDSSSKYSHC